jgi:hypothetical protein
VEQTKKLLEFLKLLELS